MVGWALFGKDEVAISGETRSYKSSGDVERHFCPACGTGLFYYSDTMFPGMVDIQSATLDDPDALAPAMRIQMADAPAWANEIAGMPSYERYPPPD